MNFDKDQSRCMIENEQSKKPQHNQDCKVFFYSCNSISKPIDSSKMSKKIYNLFEFNQKVLHSTEKLWHDLLTLDFKQKIRIKDDSCYSIVDADNCISLNKYFFSYNNHIQKLPELVSDLERDVNYFYLLNESLQSLESFLSRTLPRLENNIENLIIHMQQSFNNESFSTSYNVDNFNIEINAAILYYLEQLSQTFSHFKLNDVPDELKYIKEEIKTKINKAIAKKKDFLSSAMSEDKIKNSYDNDAVPSMVSSLDSLDTKTISNFKWEEIKNSDENPFKVKQVLNDDINGHIVYENNKFNSEISRAEPFSSKQINSMESTSLNNNVFLYSCIFSIFGFIIFLAILIFLKYKSKKEKERNKNKLFISDDEEEESFKIT